MLNCGSEFQWVSTPLLVTMDKYATLLSNWNFTRGAINFVFLLYFGRCFFSLPSGQDLICCAKKDKTKTKFWFLSCCTIVLGKKIELVVGVAFHCHGGEVVKWFVGSRLYVVADDIDDFTHGDPITYKSHDTFTHDDPIKYKGNHDTLTVDVREAFIYVLAEFVR